MGDGFPSIAFWRLVFNECTLVSGALQARPLPQVAFVALILMQLSMLVAFLLPGFGQFEPAKPLDRGNARCANESAANTLLFVAHHEHLAAFLMTAGLAGVGSRRFTVIGQSLILMRCACHRLTALDTSAH